MDILLVGQLNAIIIAIFIYVICMQKILQHNIKYRKKICGRGAVGTRNDQNTKFVINLVQKHLEIFEYVRVLVEW